jgi:hypothetical protein
MNQIEHPLDGRLSQRHYYDEACDPEFEITRPHTRGRLYQFLLAHKFRTGFTVLGLELAGKTVLEVCCGSGMLAEELAQAALTRVAVQMGIAEDVEEAGNYVYRLVPDRVAECLRQAGFERVAWQRRLMYYPHEPFPWFRWFDRAPLFWLFRAVFEGGRRSRV